MRRRSRPFRWGMAALAVAVIALILLVLSGLFAVLDYLREIADKG